MKAGYLRRNGITYNDTATLTEFFDLHDKYLTVTTLTYDPIYLTEPLLRTESFVWNPYQQLGPPHAYGATCQPAPEIPRPYGWVPHHLPGTNTVVTGFSEAYGIPFVATRGGAETMFPEYRKKLKTMTIPPQQVSSTSSQKEHEGTQAEKGARKMRFPVLLLLVRWLSSRSPSPILRFSTSAATSTCSPVTQATSPYK